MFNDRFNGGFMNGSGNFRNKKFISMAAIGIFVLILLIVLIAKGCSSKKRPVRSTPVPVAVQPSAPAPAPVAPPAPAPVTPPAIETINPPAPPAPVAVQPPPPESEARRLIKEGQAYYNGDGGKKQSYAEAQKCFLQAKKLGARDADIWLKKCAKKLPKKAAPRKRKK